MRIDLVGTTADFRRPGPQRPLPLNHLPGENRGTAGRIGEVGLADHDTIAGSRRAAPRRAEVTPALPARRAMQALSYGYIIIGAGACGACGTDFDPVIIVLP